MTNWISVNIANTASLAMYVKAPPVSLLPIDLYDFNLKTTETNEVEVRWITASEKNNDFFTIERSADGILFEKIAKVSGAGNSNEMLNYNYIDTKPLKGTSYYRLRQTDFDLREEAFDIKSIQLAASISELRLFPNPAKDFLFVESICDIESVSIYNSLGLDITYKIEIQSIHSKLIKINISSFSNNIYKIKINSNLYNFIIND